MNAETQTNAQLLHEVAELRRRVAELEAAEAQHAQSAAALHESDRRMADVIEFLPLPTMAIDRKGVVTAWNRAMQEYTGWASVEMVGKGNYQHGLPFSGTRRPILIDLVFEPEEGFEAKYKHVRREGGILSAEMFCPKIGENGVTLIGYASALRNPQGEVIGAIECVRDMTEIRKAEKELLEAQRRMADIIEFLPLPMMAIDRQGTITIWNRAMQDYSGWASVEMIGKNNHEHALPFYGERRRILIDLVFADEEEFATKYQHVLREDGILSAEAFCPNVGENGVTLIGYASELRNPQGEVIGAIECVRDMTDIRRTEAELREAQRRMADIIDFLPLPTFVIDREGIVTAWNRAMEEGSGLKAADMLGKGDHEYALAYYGERRPIMIDLVFAAEEELRTKYSHVKREGDVLVAEAYCPSWGKEGATMVGFATALRDAQGQVIAAIESCRDVTEIRKTEKELKEAQRQLADIIDFLPLPTFVIDRDGKVAAWNRAMQEYTGWASADMIGKGDYEYALPFYGERRPLLIDFVAASNEELAAKYKNVRREGDIVSAEAFAPKLGKEGMVLLNFAIALRNSAGEVVGAIESLRDITDIRRTEAQLEKAREAAVAASRAKSIFLANMSHEIRTPMNAILGFSQLMLGESGISEQQRQRLGTINRSGEHLLALINDILEMAKIEAGRITLNPVTFDLHAILDDMGMLFRQRTDAKRLQLWIERLGDVPRFVHADEGKIRQVLINLLGNAVKFTKEGGIMLRTKGLNSGPAEALVTFEVEDTGMGIAPEEMGKLFSQFEQTETGRNTAGGTGLGLAISREYVRLMGGDMTVTSEVGKGSTFFFTLPLTKADETQMVKTGDVRRVMRLRPGRPEVRVLVVDDIAENRELLSQLLEPLGFKVRYAVNGLEGVAVFETYRPHIILMDLYMPKMDGYEATKRIRGTVGGQETKVIAVTSSAFVEIQNDARAAGADDFISKPFRLTELLEKIQALINAEYEYADDAPAAATLAAAEAKGMTAETVAALPAEFLAKLRAAATDADPDQIVELLGQIAGAHADIASGLREMADRFDYEQILDLLPKGGTV